MTAFDEIGETIYQRKVSAKARKIKTRISEIERALDDVVPQHRARQASIMRSETTPRNLPKNIAAVGKVCLVIASVIVAVKIMAWVSPLLLVVGSH